MRTIALFLCLTACSDDPTDSDVDSDSDTQYNGINIDDGGDVDGPMATHHVIATLATARSPTAFDSPTICGTRATRPMTTRRYLAPSLD